MQPGYNSSYTSADIWSDALIQSQTKPKARGKIRKSEIVHFPEFERCLPYLDDPYWITIFTKCSRKKFPRGFVYSDHYLKHRANNITIALPDDDQAFALTARYFFQENGKLYSERDREYRRKQKEELIIERVSNETTDWSKVARSKNRRASHVRDYVERRYKNLPKNVRDELFTQINVSFENRRITKEQITFEKGQIVNIDGIDANSEGIVHYRPLPKHKATVFSTDCTNKDKAYRHFETWCKYIEDYKKHLVSSTKSSHILQTVSYSGSNSSDSGQLNVYSN